MKNGYTLVELSISVSIMAMLAVGALHIIDKKNSANALRDTLTKLDKIELQLKQFKKHHGYYPCPTSDDNLCDSGMIPIKQLGLPKKYLTDGWHTPFMYRIATNANNPNIVKLSHFRGNISIVDLHGTPKTYTHMPPPYHYGAEYVIISYGKNGLNSSNLAEVANQTHDPFRTYTQSGPTSVFDDIVRFY